MKEWLSKLDPKWVASNIIGWGFLAASLSFVAFYMVLPTQEKAFKTQDELVATQREITKAIQELSSYERAKIQVLERIDRNTSK